MCRTKNRFRTLRQVMIAMLRQILSPVRSAINEVPAESDQETKVDEATSVLCRIHGHPPFGFWYGAFDMQIMGPTFLKCYVIQLRN
jgi:hypothetical protein